jgi:DNA-binding response OmpR family regulator
MRGTRGTPWAPGSGISAAPVPDLDAGHAGEDMQLLAVRGGAEALQAALRGCGFDVELIGRVPMSAPSRHSDHVRVGALVVDSQAHEVRVGHRIVRCTRTEFRLLERLAAHAGQVLSRRQLLIHVHGSADFMVERTIDSHVRNLRRKLEHPPVTGAPRITTVFGVGYKLVDPARTPSMRLVR